MTLRKTTFTRPNNNVGTTHNTRNKLSTNFRQRPRRTHTPNVISRHPRRTPQRTTTTILNRRIRQLSLTIPKHSTLSHTRTRQLTTITRRGGHSNKIIRLHTQRRISQFQQHINIRIHGITNRRRIRINSRKTFNNGHRTKP